MMTTTATKTATAEELYAEGMSLLESGDTLGASELLWAAATTAIEAYAEMRGWVPNPRRGYYDIIRLRVDELGIGWGEPGTHNPVTDPFAAASMFEGNLWEGGNLLTNESAKRDARDMKDLLEVFRVDD